MRYEVMVDGSQLTYGSLGELKKLYEQGFVAPEDLVRPEGGERWVRASQMPALRTAEAKSKIETRMVQLVAIAAAFSLVVGAAVLKYKQGALLGLIGLGVLVPFVVYRRRR